MFVREERGGKGKVLKNGEGSKGWKGRAYRIFVDWELLLVRLKGWS